MKTPVSISIWRNDQVYVAQDETGKQVAKLSSGEVAFLLLQAPDMLALLRAICSKSNHETGIVQAKHLLHLFDSEVTL